MTHQTLPHIVIVGGGFGGLWAAQGLKDAPVRVTLIDKRNHHLFQPLLYQVATAGLSAPDIAAPLRHILREQANVTVLLGEVLAVEPANQRLLLKDAEPLSYDTLVLATGATHAYFGRDDWARFAPGLKTLDDAVALRRKLLLAFERAEAETDPQTRSAYLTFVVVGGGPTGVELAGTLAEIARHTLRREFRRIDPSAARICLVEAGPRVLGSFPEALSDKARRQLQKLGVEVLTGQRVLAIDGEGVSFGEQTLRAKTVLWAAGVAASPLGKSLGVPLDRAGRVIIDASLRVADHPEIYVAGDLVALTQDGQPVPGVAPAAKQMGRYIAASIKARLNGARVPAFRYQHAGSLATIGRMAAVVDFGRLQLSGVLAWWFWLMVHILFLIGFRNRLVVLLNWGWSYWTYQRHARIIFEDKDDSD